MKNGILCSFSVTAIVPATAIHIYTNREEFHRSLPDRENCKKYRIDIRAHEGKILEGVFSEININILV